MWLLLDCVLLLIGDQDSSVPPYHTRRMARHLEECGVEVTFTEVRGKVPHIIIHTADPRIQETPNLDSDSGFRISIQSTYVPLGLTLVHKLSQLMYHLA
jgi:acetyl esterase/lipase